MVFKGQLFILLSIAVLWPHWSQSVHIALQNISNNTNTRILLKNLCTKTKEVLCTVQAGSALSTNHILPLESQDATQEWALFEIDNGDTNPLTKLGTLRLVVHKQANPSMYLVEALLHSATPIVEQLPVGFWAEGFFDNINMPNVSQRLPCISYTRAQTGLSDTQHTHEPHFNLALQLQQQGALALSGSSVAVTPAQQ